MDLGKPIIEIDIIIISYAYDEHKRELTEQTIQTLLDSESQQHFLFHIIVIESAKNALPYKYPNTQTIKPNQKFGYHTYLNIGVKAGKSNWIALANNDLIFKKGWASAIIEANKLNPELESFGTWCENFHIAKSVAKTPLIQYGYTNGIHITGWFIFLTRDLYNEMNGLDEKFIFWYCDDDYRMTIKSMDKKHALITNAEITHITSQTTIEMDRHTYRKMTLLPNLYFDYKWNHRSYIVYVIKKLYFMIMGLWK